MNNNPTITPQVVTSPFHNFCMSIGAIPTSYKDTLDYYETLLWLIKFLDSQVLPALNTNGEAVSELQGLYIQLKDFIEHYFDNLDVQEEIDNKLDEMVEDGTLENLINQKILTNISTSVQNLYDNIKFQPKVYASMYMIDDNENTIKERILKWKEMGVNGIIVLINFNNDDNLSIQDNLTMVNNLINYAIENNIAVDTIKFHCLLRQRVDVDTLQIYQNQVNYVLTTLDAKNKGINRITLFNELPYIYGPNATQETKNKAISIITSLKNEGYKVGITCSNLELGIGYMINYSPDLCNVVDFFAFNYYQVFPFKKELTSFEDSINAWKHSLDAIYTYKTQYPDKPIILSETGCLNNWLNMMDPSDFTLNRYPANGKTYPIYFYGLFNNKNYNKYLDEMWLWYDEVMVNYPDVIKFMNTYLGGNINA